METSAGSSRTAFAGISAAAASAAGAQPEGPSSKLRRPQVLCRCGTCVQCCKPWASSLWDILPTELREDILARATKLVLMSMAPEAAEVGRACAGRSSRVILPPGTLKARDMTAFSFVTSDVDVDLAGEWRFAGGVEALIEGPYFWDDNSWYHSLSFSAEHESVVRLHVRYMLMEENGATKVVFEPAEPSAEEEEEEWSDHDDSDEEMDDDGDPDYIPDSDMSE